MINKLKQHATGKNVLKYGCHAFGLGFVLFSIIAPFYLTPTSLLVWTICFYIILGTFKEESRQIFETPLIKLL